MSSRRKGESIEDYRAREAARKRRSRGGTGEPPPAAMTGPVIVAPEGSGSEPVFTLYQRIGALLRGERCDACGQPKEAPMPRDVAALCTGFSRLVGGLRQLQSMASRDEVRRIVELVDAELSDATREKLQRLLDQIDARAGVTG